MTAEVVEADNTARFELRDEELLDPGIEVVPVFWTGC
jgi:hypothetical protein